MSREPSQPKRDLEPSFHLVSEYLEEPLPYVAYRECIGAD